MENTRHPLAPRSNVAKFSGYEPDKYALTDVSPTVLTHEDLIPNQPPVLTQCSIGKHLLATTHDLSEYGPRPTTGELPDKVLEQMVKRDKAFWVDKPGTNAYTLHDAYYNYGMTTEMVKPRKKAIRAQCRDCNKMHILGLTPFQLAWAKDPGQKRWRYYPDVAATLTTEEINVAMRNIGRPFQNEACNWYFENYPPKTYDCIMRKFSG